MSPRGSRFRIEDILEAILKVESYVEGMDLIEFSQDVKTIDAVIRNFIVIGEAASRLPKEFTSINGEVPWRLMADMRNFAVHQYWGVEIKSVWKTIKNDLPPLIAVLEKLLNNLGNE